MTTLYIAGEAVVLPKGFNFRIIEENPFFTKNGKYTYDIELMLDNPINARIYKHINRRNFAGTITDNRSAVLVVDNKVELNGTELITGWSNKSVKIQLASGNSELNFLIGGDKNIRDLSLGSVTVSPTAATDPDIIYAPNLVNILSQTYPVKNFNLIPFITDVNNFIGNWWFYENEVVDVFPSNPRYYGDNYRPQPYFNAIIEKILVSLGYTLDYNAIAEHDYFKYMYLVHGYLTLEYAKMLPSWSVNDFFTKIEKQFDCTVIVSEKTKKISIYFNSEKASITTNEDITVLDSYTTDVDRDNHTSIKNSNLSYAFDDFLTFKYKKLPKEVKDYSIEATYTDVADLVAKINDAGDADRYKKIFKGPLGDMIAYNNGTGSSYTPRKVDEFKDLFQNDKDSIDEEFSILPAAMTFASTTFVYNTSEGVLSYGFDVQLPVAIGAEPSEEEITESFKLNDLINGNEKIESIQTQDKMYVALYMGLKTIDFTDLEPESPIAGYPIPFVESLCEYFTGGTPRYFLPEGVHPFRLEWLRDNLYTSSEVDTTKVVHQFFMQKPDIDILSAFIANNKKYLCIKYEREITNKGITPVFEGDFYPVE